MAARCLYVWGTDDGDDFVEWLLYKMLCVVASVVFVTYFSLSYSIDCCILSYTILAAADVYLFVTNV